MYNSESIERLSVKTSATYGEMSRVSIETSKGISPFPTDDRISESVTLETARINERSLFKSERKVPSSLVLFLSRQF